MQKKRFTLLTTSICLVLFALSCKQHKEKNIPKIFPVEKHLKATILPFDFIIARESCTIADDCLIFISRGTDTLIYVFSLPEIELINSFGTNGKGPDEFAAPPSFIKNNSDLLCLSGNSNLSLLKCFEIDKNSKTVTLLKEYSLKDISFLDLRNLHIINDSILFYFECVPYKMQIGSYDLMQEKRIASKEIEVNEEHEQMIEYFNIGFLMANSQTLTYSYLYQDKIDFMHPDFSLINAIKDENSKVYIDDSWVNNQSIIYYTAGYAGREKFYFLYSGCGVNEIAEGGKNRSIEVFDNKGIPLVKYYLDFPIYEFTVDEKNNKLYGWYDDDDVILVYEL